MSDLVTRNTLHALWDEILKLHWIYLETEESVEKIDNQEKLEVYLKEFLGIVQPDRKFFLPETPEVLKKTIRDLEEFDVLKAIAAFSSISQYANNLYSKPWRKEFRLLKMYSGFYQHEIKSNLLDAEVLFEAMGYRRLSGDSLILDGPICPDQVMNVSRDAITAYVELRIIKVIHATLDSLGVSCSWLDIYRYREQHTGNAAETISALEIFVQRKRIISRQKASVRDNYDYIDVQPSQNIFSTNTPFCKDPHRCLFHHQQVPLVARHGVRVQSNGVCSVPEHQNFFYSNMCSPAEYQHNFHYNGEVPLPQMLHSRSLDHYGEQDIHRRNTFPHRHSFDHQQQGCTAHHPHHYAQQMPQEQYQCYQDAINQQQQNFYESPYDCIDGSSLGGGSSNISYADVARNAGTGTVAMGTNCNLNSSSTYSHPYNVSGNRFPLPLNISNQLSAYDNIQSDNGLPNSAYSHCPDQHIYSSISKLPQSCMLNVSAHAGKDSLLMQLSCQAEQFIKVEDANNTLPSTTPFQQQFTPNDTHQYRQSCETTNHTTDKHYNNPTNMMENPIPLPATITCEQHCASGQKPSNDNMYVYAKPTPREYRKQNASSLRKYQYHAGERGDTTDMSYDSANDDVSNRPCQEENERNQQNSPTQFTKDRDGFGSVEHWSNVFKSLEKSGYPKDRGERSDLLVQSLDLDSLNIIDDTSPSRSNSTEKQNSESEKKNSTRQQHEQSNKTIENAKYLSNNKATIESSVHSPNNKQNKKTPLENNTRKIKSGLKQSTSTTSKSNSSLNPNPNRFNNTQPKTNDNKKLNNKTMNNNNIDSSINTGNKINQRPLSKKSSAIVSTNTPSLPTEPIMTSAKEWNCNVCTFLNPSSKRICEMCFNNKDFNLDAPNTSATTAGTPTCA